MINQRESNCIWECCSRL